MATLASRTEIDDMSAKAFVLFSTGHIQEASQMWHGVVRRLLPLVTSDLAEPGLGNSEAECLTRTLVAHPPWEMASPAHSSLITSEDRTFAVYASAVQYAAHPSVARTLDDDLALAATSVFNLGLFHHLQGLLGGGESDASRSYEKALRAYRASQQILEGSGLCGSLEEADPQPPQHPGLILLQLALANNMGHLHDQMHSHDDARLQLGILRSLAASLDRAMMTTPSPMAREETEEFVPFLLTAALYPDCRAVCRPAPAA